MKKHAKAFFVVVKSKKKKPNFFFSELKLRSEQNEVLKSRGAGSDGGKVSKGKGKKRPTVMKVYEALLQVDGYNYGGRATPSLSCTSIHPFSNILAPLCALTPVLDTHTHARSR